MASLGDGIRFFRATPVPPGEQAGNAFRWRYTRRVPMSDGSDSRLNFDDWFWLQDGEVLISRAAIGRFGIEFAGFAVLGMAVALDLRARRRLVSDAVAGERQAAV